MTHKKSFYPSPVFGCRVIGSRAILLLDLIRASVGSSARAGDRYARVDGDHLGEDIEDGLREQNISTNTSFTMSKAVLTFGTVLS